ALLNSIPHRWTRRRPAPPPRTNHSFVPSTRGAEAPEREEGARARVCGVRRPDLPCSRRLDHHPYQVSPFVAPANPSLVWLIPRFIFFGADSCGICSAPAVLAVGNGE
uniref:Uncharacterized protein n=1 Tax=Aegilops tauschii subsp. strangulata TaxID=200361 RepID=A0A453PEN3_AEGTS